MWEGQMAADGCSLYRHFAADGTLHSIGALQIERGVL
jgi:hypothetical protein